MAPDVGVILGCLVVFALCARYRTIHTTEEARFIFVAGAPLDEPVAWHGPIVMNTKEEIQEALLELQNGTFIKSNALPIEADIKSIQKP